MCWDGVKRDLRFRKRIQVLFNSSGLLRYGPETVLTGLQRFLPPFGTPGGARPFKISRGGAIFRNAESPQASPPLGIFHLTLPGTLSYFHA